MVAIVIVKQLIFVNDPKNEYNTWYKMTQQVPEQIFQYALW